MNLQTNHSMQLIMYMIGLASLNPSSALGQSVITASPPDRSEMIQLVAETLPATLKVELGEIPLNEQTLMWVEITNKTGEQFVAKDVKTDCGCALGYVVDSKTEHGDACRVYVRAIPTQPGRFERAITLVGSDGSDRTISLRLVANVKPRFETKPRTLRVFPKSSAPMSITLVANFEDEFHTGEPPTVDSKQAFTLIHEASAKKSLKFSLSVKDGRNLVHRPDTCQIKFHDCGGKSWSIDLPLYWIREPKVFPSIIRMRGEDSEAKFFINGDFGHELDVLKHSKLWLVSKDQKFEVRATWKSESLCACLITLKKSEIAEHSTDERIIQSELWIKFPDMEPELVARIDIHDNLEE